MKVIIQIPCYNEEKNLSDTLRELPRTLPGVASVEWLIIDDGSTDNTVEVAKQAGVDHIVKLPSNRGLAKGFMSGIEACLSLGADIIVNTDADNQYCAADIQFLIKPILENKADIVIGERPIMATSHFSFTKKMLQKIGSFVARRLSRVDVKDAPSGFRAISKATAYRLNVFNEYTYTIETIIQAGKQGMRVVSVPVRTNPDVRPSKLVKSIPNYIKQNMFIMLRTLNTYNPINFFFKLAIIPLLTGLGLGVRWIVLYMGAPASHIPSLILVAILLIIGVQFVIFGFIADLISVNRKLLEDIQFKARKQQDK